MSKQKLEQTCTSSEPAACQQEVRSLLGPYGGGSFSCEVGRRLITFTQVEKKLFLAEKHEIQK